MKTTDKRHKLMKYLLAGVLILPIGMQRLLNVNAVDLDEDCFLELDPGEFESLKSYLEKHDDALQIDIYRVASCLKDEKYDTFSYELLSPFTGSLTGYDISAYSGDDTSVKYLSDIDNDMWLEVAQQLTTVVKDNELDPTATLKAYEKSSALDSGLYLVIARSKDLTDAADYIQGDEGEYVTIANTDTKVYKFKPQLVSLPSSFPDLDKPTEHATIDPDANVNTAQGNWVYDITAVLKAEEEDRVGKVRIVKKLLSWDDGSEATFAFQISASAEEYTYENTESITFFDAGDDSVELTNIRVGAEVIVGEICPSNYELVSTEILNQTDGKPVVLPLTNSDGEENEPLTFVFVNKYRPTKIKGYGVKNTFTYSEEDGWQNGGNDLEDNTQK